MWPTPNESSVAFAFVVIAAAAVTATASLLVAGLAGHAVKDLWQRSSSSRSPRERTSDTA
jgi:hypothetical protein